MKESNGLRTQVGILEGTQENLYSNDIKNLNFVNTKNNLHYQSTEIQKIEKNDKYNSDSKDEEDLNDEDHYSDDGFVLDSKQQNNKTSYNLESYPSSDGEADDDVSDRNSTGEEYSNRRDGDSRLFLAVAGTLEAVCVFSRISSKQSRYETALLLESRKSLLMHGRIMIVERGRERKREDGSDGLISDWTKYEDIDGYYHVGVESMLLATPVQVGGKMKIEESENGSKNENIDSCMMLCNFFLI